MAIVLRQKGEAALVAKAGKAISRQREAEKTQARAERQEQQAIQLAERRRAEQAARDWELEKMRLRSQQDFQQELATKQWDYEKFNRAKAWEIEKMEIASRNDFEQEEKERVEKHAKWAAGDKAIVESDDIYPTPEAKERARWEWKYKSETGLYPPRQQRPVTEREKMEEFVGSIGREMGLPELREEAMAAGYVPPELSSEDVPGIGDKSGYELGQVISTPEGDMEITGFDEDGEPLVDPVGNKRNKYGGYGATGSF
jgi:hypothetical protein